MDGVAEHTDLHVRARNSGQLESATETLVLGRIIVLKTELKVNGLEELALLALDLLTVDGDFLTGGVSEDVLNRSVEDLGVEFTALPQQRRQQTGTERFSLQIKE